MINIRAKLATKSNDYTNISNQFEKKTGFSLVSQTQQDFPLTFNEPVSIIVPVYNGNRTLPPLLNALNDQLYKNFEVILVDDASSENILELLLSLKNTLNIKYLKLNNNKGNTYGRNRGVELATHNTLIFLDQDMVPHKHFVLNFAFRQHHTTNCTFLGFKEEIELTDLNLNRRARIEKDWRVEQPNYDYLLPIALNSRVAKGNANVFRLLDETNNLKNFGNGKIIGFWDLPCMVISHSFSVKKNVTYNAGGFYEKEFKRWGLQDIALGAALIANDEYIVPTLENISYHINHERFSGSRQIERKELEYNLGVYLRLAERPVQNFPKTESVFSKVDRINNISIYSLTS